ncbi:chorismate mutase [Candidatus Aerophobetes bacterium]|uniref:Chorismate mutase n=1 Tax=Aerophobetes bacterium TaxID=2030807 RepID=A0A2A4YM38_UNCAE|nr:MAG: chorismate mutase [Candidatus Aerophobetes bacterium]
MYMDELRKEIEEIHEDLLNLLKRRSEVTKKIAKIKQENNLPIYDPFREELLIENMKKLAKKKEIDPQMAELMLRIILTFSKKEMQDVLKGK